MKDNKKVYIEISLEDLQEIQSTLFLEKLKFCTIWKLLDKTRLYNVNRLERAIRIILKDNGIDIE